MQNSLFNLNSKTFSQKYELLWCFLGHPATSSGDAAFHWVALLQKFALSTIHLSAKRWIFFLHWYWLTHWLNTPKRKQSTLQTYFGFTPKSVTRETKMSGRKLIRVPQLMFMLVHCLTSLILFQHNTGALQLGGDSLIATRCFAHWVVTVLSGHTT